MSGDTAMDSNMTRGQGLIERWQAGYLYQQQNLNGVEVFQVEEVGVIF